MKKKIYAKKKKTSYSSKLRHKTRIHEAAAVQILLLQEVIHIIYVLSLGHVKTRRLPIVVSVTVANWLLLLGKLET